MPGIRVRALAMLAFGAATLASPSANAVTSINVAVAANFTTTMSALIAAFRVIYPGTNITFRSDSSAVLQNQIINRTVVYDLFLSADKARPVSLATNNPTRVVGAPFLYAVGELELWSPTVNISAGLPFPLTQNIVIADPARAPYGLAASQVLDDAPWRITGPFPNILRRVYTASNISLTYSAIKGGAYPYGFIAQSQICRLVNGRKTFSAGFHRTYAFNDPVHPHTKIEQFAIRVANPARTAAQNTVLTNFVNFLRVNATGRRIVTSFCYSLT